MFLRRMSGIGLLKSASLTGRVGRSFFNNAESFSDSNTQNQAKPQTLTLPRVLRPALNPSPPARSSATRTPNTPSTVRDLPGNPKQNALVGLPTLVHVTSPTQNATLSLFGQSISIALEASHFSYDFGDGSPTLETTDPSAPYPVQTLNHVYTQTSPGRIITLTTTWNATITYPSGRSVYLANALTSTEASTPITILRAKINLIPTDK